jgi:hypothetical protein
VGVEPTRDTKYRTTGLKPAPSTGQDWLPGAILTNTGQTKSAILQNQGMGPAIWVAGQAADDRSIYPPPTVPSYALLIRAPLQRRPLV